MSALDLLSKQAHDNAVEAGHRLAEAQVRLDRAEEILKEANIRLSNARRFEQVLIERQKKLDRAFVALNKQKSILKTQQLREDERDLLVRENIKNF